MQINKEAMTEDMKLKATGAEGLISKILKNKDDL
jgi:hypothetical protein